MPEGYRAGNGAAPLLLALAAATLSAVLLPAMMPAVVAAAKKQPIISSNCSLCSAGDASSLPIAQAQPELEGFEMTAGLGPVVVSQQSSGTCPSYIKTGDLIEPDKAGCGRVKRDERYYCCTTDPNYNISPQQCSPTNRERPCP